MATTHNYWNLKNEHIKNLLVISLTMVLVVLALISSRILVSALASIGPVISGGNLTEAFKLALNRTKESQLWLNLSEFIRCVLCLFIVYIFIKRFNKETFSWTKVGFNFKPKSILLFIVGVAIYCLTFFSSFFLSSVWGVISPPATWIQTLFQLNTGQFFILAFTQNFFNALWQEIIFRAYLQTRLIKVYGAMRGILLTSIIFVLLHGFIRPMSVMEIITGIVIFSFVGFLFHKSKSIFLITGIHGTGNFLMTIFVGANIPLPRYLDRLLAFGIMFMVAYILLKRTRGIERTISSHIPNIKYKNHLTKSL